MAVPAYRITAATTVVVCEGNSERLKALDAGSIVIPTSAPDSAGLIDAICDGNSVRIFARDLDEKSEAVEAAMDGRR